MRQGSVVSTLLRDTLARHGENMRLHGTHAGPRCRPCMRKAVPFRGFEIQGRCPEGSSRVDSAQRLASSPSLADPAPDQDSHASLWLASCSYHEALGPAISSWGFLTQPFTVPPPLHGCWERVKLILDARMRNLPDDCLLRCKTVHT